MFNHQSLNPAYAGSKEYTHFAILHRTQWLNFPGAPESQAFTFNHKISSKNFGFGLTGVNDKIGPLNGNRIAIDLAYHLPLNDAFLAVGIKVGISNFDFDESLIQTTEPNDLAFTFDEEGKFIPNVGFGMYYHNSRWYAGFSIPWFIEKENLKLQRHYYGIFGGLFSLSNQIKAKPSGLIKHTQGSALSYDLSMLLLFRELFWIGPQIRSSISDAPSSTSFGGGLGILGGIYLNKNISLGYAFNPSSLGEFVSIHHSTHEILLRFDLIPAVKTMLRSPRIF